MIVMLAVCAIAILGQPAEEASAVSVIPHESPDADLHNPDMGWVIYENYPLDQDPHGSSTMLILPDENFPDVDTVAVMFSWQDIEQQPDKYDFSKVDFAYDYWHERGKAIQLRMSTTTLLWWANRTPPAGAGAPAYVRDRLAANEKQTRTLEGLPYDVEDARNPYYQERLRKFLSAVNDHFSAARPVTLIDLRGFGVWGEWHSGFQYAALEDRRTALKQIIDVWCESLPNHRLALSYSYDPDSPPEFYAGSTHDYDAAATAHYDDYLSYSAFDYALTKPNVTFRRDGCGGAVHSNERKLNEAAYRLGRGPMFSEFVDGYSQSKAGGKQWVDWKIDDALSLHPNYICLLGWQGSDVLAFLHERRDLVEHGLRRMGYRLVPTHVTYPTTIVARQPFNLDVSWTNRGAGRAVRNYTLRAALIDDSGHIIAATSAGELATSKLSTGDTMATRVNVQFDSSSSADYQLAIGLYDAATKRAIALPLDGPVGGMYRVGDIRVDK